MRNRTLPTLGLLVFFISNGAFAGQLDLGAQYQTWTSNYASPLEGHEILTPVFLSLDPWRDVNFYAQGEYAGGQYTDPLDGTQNLSDISDTVAGVKAGFKSFSCPSFVNIGVNLPTGNQVWESETRLANIPADFVDDRYQGRGFGLSGIYGIALPAGATQYGLGVGYLYTGAFNPNYGTGAPAENLKLGDAIFLSLNRVTTFASNQVQAITASAYFNLPTLEQNQNFIWMGPNLNLSYSWTDPRAFSLGAGVQYFFPGQTSVSGQWVAEPHDSLGARFFLDPSWAIGDFLLACRVKYVLANGYDPSPEDLLYDGGGILLGIAPSYKIALDSQSAFLLSASYDYITADGAAADAQGNRVNVTYNRLTMGADYEIKL